MNKKYITTPIYYPNGLPHIGSAYTTIAADVLARYYRIKGENVQFLTGTDEHGRKIQKAAEEKKLEVAKFIEENVKKFKEAWKDLDISYDRFIRTTDPDHEKAVEQVLKTVYEKGDIYKGTYEGHYCTQCEAYYTEKDAHGLRCPIHKKPLELLKEESYFFKLSKYQKNLLEHYKKNPSFLEPEKRAHEIINRVKEGLQDLSISRKTLTWGIPLPFDKSHVTYVWFDALTNYLTGAGYPSKKADIKKWWPADVHLVGKDIFWFHAVIWPAMLFSAGIELPRKIFAHGFLTNKGEKVGKSAGNMVPLDTLLKKVSSDSLRYYLLRETPFGEDGEFSQDMLIERNNNELANKLGNLVARVSTLAEKYGLEKAEPLKTARLKKASEHLESLKFEKYISEVFAFIDECNEFIQKKKPWETKDTKVIYMLANALKDIAILLYPLMPKTAESISKTFNTEISWKDLDILLKITKIKKSDILFEKVT